MINRVVLVGRLTRDVEVKKTSSGLSVASFTLACNRRGGSQGQPQADFISCVAWRQQADFLGQYAKKGAVVALEGKIQTRNYDGMDGKKVYVTEVVADSVQLVGSRSENSNSNYQPQPSNNVPSYNADPGFDDFSSGVTLDISSDDLPF